MGVKYAERIQQHLDAKEEKLFYLRAYRALPAEHFGNPEWDCCTCDESERVETGGAKVELTAASNVAKQSNSKWNTKHETKG